MQLEILLTVIFVCFWFSLGTIFTINFEEKILNDPNGLPFTVYMFMVTLWPVCLMVCIMGAFIGYGVGYYSTWQISRRQYHRNKDQIVS